VTAAPALAQLSGTLAASGFESGDRFVIGRWTRSPIGATALVMWSRPDGTRLLLAPDSDAAGFFSAAYEVDDVQVVPFAEVGSMSPSEVHITAGDLRVRLNAGWRVLWLPDRPRWVTRWIERPLFGAVTGVRLWGRSRSGVEEWYQAHSCRFVHSGAAEIDGRDLGGTRPVHPACRFGPCEPPRRPSIIDVDATFAGLRVGRDAREAQ
jgi:hypothetical protein